MGENQLRALGSGVGERNSVPIIPRPLPLDAESLETQALLAGPGCACEWPGTFSFWSSALQLLRGGH